MRIRARPLAGPAAVLGCQLGLGSSSGAGTLCAAGRSLPGTSLAFALMAAINGSTGSSATLAYGLKAPSLAGVSPAAARFSLLRGGGASPQRHWPVNGGDGVEKSLHNGSTPVAGRRGVSPSAGSAPPWGGSGLPAIGFSSLTGGRSRPGTLSHNRAGDPGVSLRLIPRRWLGGR